MLCLSSSSLITALEIGEMSWRLDHATHAVWAQGLLDQHTPSQENTVLASIFLYQLSPRRTPLGPALNVRLREMYVL